MRKPLHLMLLSLVFIAWFMASLTAGAAVWRTTEQWTPDWESRYRQWVLTQWDKDYFQRPGPFQNVLMDCADTVYAMRLVFAAEHGLPFAMKDATGGKALITNEMTRWDDLSESQRKRRFLLYVFVVGSTASLPNDTYPVAVNRDAIGSGTLLLTDRLSHHSWTVKYVSETGIPFLLFSSRPARTVLFERYEFPSMEFTFPGGLQPERHAGFRAFRVPADLGKPVWEVNGYSLEQYQIPVSSWIKTMQKRLQLRAETPEGHVARVLAEACKGALERVEAIRLGVSANAKIGSRCMNAQEYDDFSTPNRDKRMKGTFDDLVAAYEDLKALRAKIAPELKIQVESVLAGEGSAADPAAHCPVQLAPGLKLTLGQIFVRSRDGRLSNNPHDSLEMRWGLESFPSAKARSCPVY